VKGSQPLSRSRAYAQQSSDSCSSQDSGLPDQPKRHVRYANSSPIARLFFLASTIPHKWWNEAMNVGGHGYVTKIDAAAELLRAIQSVREGARFVSQRIRD
jgi:DNA-binding NarL/FixJ family response regulator